MIDSGGTRSDRLILRPQFWTAARVVSLPASVVPWLLFVDIGAPLAPGSWWVPVWCAAIAAMLASTTGLYLAWYSFGRASLDANGAVLIAPGVWRRRVPWSHLQIKQSSPNSIVMVPLGRIGPAFVGEVTPAVSELLSRAGLEFGAVGAQPVGGPTYRCAWVPAERTATRCLLLLFVCVLVPFLIFLGLTAKRYTFDSPGSQAILACAGLPDAADVKLEVVAKDELMVELSHEHDGIRVRCCRFVTGWAACASGSPLLVGGPSMCPESFDCGSVPPEHVIRYLGERDPTPMPPGTPAGPIEQLEPHR